MLLLIFFEVRYDQMVQNHFSKIMRRGVLRSERTYCTVWGINWLNWVGDATLYIEKVRFFHHPDTKKTHELDKETMQNSVQQTAKFTKEYTKICYVRWMTSYTYVINIMKYCKYLEVNQKKIEQNVLHHNMVTSVSIRNHLN